MKYIKTFEGLFTNLFKKKPVEILYNEITSEDFAETFSNHNREELTNFEKNKLNRYNKYGNIDIYKLDDEWFLIMIWVEGLPKYYKCDTFEGLLQFLEEKKNILKTNILGN